MEECRESLTENLIVSQIIKNVLYRDTVLTHLKPIFFNDEENGKLFGAIHQLVVKDKIQKLDKKTLQFKYDNGDKLNEIFAEDDYPTENIDFLLALTEKWGKNNALAEAVMLSADRIEEKKDVGSIGNLIEEALSFSFDRNLGLNYIEDVDRRTEFYTRATDKLKTDFIQLDGCINDGLPRKTLTISAGASGLGKTLFGTNLTTNFIKQGYNGVYVTLELAEELIGRRIDSALSKESYMGLSNESTANSMVKKLRKWQKKGLGKLFIKEYPPSKACCLNLKTYLKELELVEKIKPDFLIVDYVQLMKPNNDRGGMNSYDKYKEIAEELRELAMELDIAVISFSQVRRDGYGNSSSDMTHISDSMGIVNTADLVIMMTKYEPDNLSNAEKQNCVLQMWKVVKNRLGMVGGYFIMSLNTSTLQLTDCKDRTEEMLFNTGEEMTDNNKKANSDSEDDETEDVVDFVGPEDEDDVSKEQDRQDRKAKDGSFKGKPVKKRGIDESDRGRG